MHVHVYRFTLIPYTRDQLKHASDQGPTLTISRGKLDPVGSLSQWYEFGCLSVDCNRKVEITLEFKGVVA